MRYGSLTISRTDGSTTEFGIEQVSSTVGRGSANHLEIDDPSIDERHARIAIEGGNLMVEDLGSRTGVFVEGQRIPPNTPTLVRDNATLRFGDVSVVYGPPTGAGTGGSASPVAPPPVRRGRLELSLVPPLLSVEPGSTAYVRAELLNTDSVVDEFRIGIEGIEQDWIEAPDDTVRLLPGERAERTFAISPPRTGEAFAGERRFTIRANSIASGTEVSAQGAVEVGAYAEIAHEVTPVRGAGPFSLSLASVANQPVALSLEARDDESALVYEFDQPFVTLEPGGATAIRIDVHPAERKLFGQPKVVPFTVSATRPDHGDEAVFTTQGQLQVTPPLERYKRPAMFIIPLIALGIIGLIAFLLLRGNGEVTASEDEEPIPTQEAMALPTSLPDSPDRVEAFHLCALEPAERPRLYSGAGLSVFDSEFEGFAQNDPRWATAEYAHAQTDPQSGIGCGTTLAQCGCALTSMATVMGLLDLAVLPNDNELSPLSLNDWYRQDASLTNGGWVSRGFIYGNVLWTAVNDLSAQMNTIDPNMSRLRYSHFGLGTEAEIREDLDRGRPVILEVPGHFVAAIGYTSDGAIRIKDPAYTDRVRLGDYAGQVIKSVHFEPTFNSQAVAVTVPMHLRVRVTDEDGNQTGSLDGGTAEELEGNFQNDIPGASFAIQRAWRDPTCEFSPPEDDQGTIQLILNGDSKYTVEVVDPDGGPLSWAVHRYEADGTGLDILTGSSGMFEIDELGLDPSTAVPDTPTTSGDTPTAQADTPTTAPDTPTTAPDTPTTPPASITTWVQDPSGVVLEDGAIVQPGDQLSLCMSANRSVDITIEILDPAGNLHQGPSLTGIQAESCPVSLSIDEDDAPGPWVLTVRGPQGALASVSFVIRHPPTAVPQMQVVRLNVQGPSATAICGRRDINWIIEGDPQGSATLTRQHLQGGQWIVGRVLVSRMSPPGRTSTSPTTFNFTVRDEDALAVNARYVLDARNRNGVVEDSRTSRVIECHVQIN